MMIFLWIALIGSSAALAQGTVVATGSTKIRTEIPHPDNATNHRLSEWLAQSGTHGLLVWQDGKVIFEKYQFGFHSESRFLLWSGAKSILSALVGRAVLQEKLKLDDSVCAHMPETKSLAHPKMCEIQIQDLLYWRSGLAWNESYERSPLQSDIVNILYGNGAHRVLPSILSKPIRYSAGSRYSYSSADSNLLAHILQNVWKNDPKFPWTELFEPLGMSSAVVEKDHDNLYLFSSFAYLNMNDSLRFAELFYRDGVWKNQNFLPEGFVASLLELPQRHQNSTQPEHHYERAAGHWWRPSQALRKSYPHWGDAYWASGHWGQKIAIFPSQKTIVIRFGDDRVGQPFRLETLGGLLGWVAPQ